VSYERGALTLTTSNGEQEAIRLERAVAAFLERLEEVPADLQTQPPAEGEWTVKELAAHEAEIFAYWGQQMGYVKTHPGQPFGRTAEDPDRIKYVEDHRNDPLPELASAIRLGADQAAAALRSFSDDEWSRVTGVHSRRGEMDMDAISNLFVAGHAEEHLKQLDETVAAIRQEERG
jgi:DinB superfamily